MGQYSWFTVYVLRMARAVTVTFFAIKKVILLLFVTIYCRIKRVMKKECNYRRDKMNRLLILGAGGFGQMVKETAAALGYEEIVFLDDA